mgnify:CR=1 FL=1
MVVPVLHPKIRSQLQRHSLVVVGVHAATHVHYKLRVFILFQRRSGAYFSWLLALRRHHLHA